MKLYRFRCNFQNEEISLDVSIDKLPEQINGVWQPITTTLPDGFKEDDPDIMKFYKTLGSYVNKLTMENTKDMISELGKGSLSDSETIEWQLKDLWPQTINVGNLCRSTTNETVEVTWRYSESIKYPFITGLKTPKNTSGESCQELN